MQFSERNGIFCRGAFAALGTDAELFKATTSAKREEWKGKGRLGQQFWKLPLNERTSVAKLQAALLLSYLVYVKKAPVSRLRAAAGGWPLDIPAAVKSYLVATFLEDGGSGSRG